MKTRKCSLRRYYFTIRSYLPCSHKMKKRILDEIRANILRYLEEHPDTDFGQIEARFGKPKDIAAAYVDDMNTAELLHILRIRRRIVTTATIGIIIALTIWGSFLSLAHADSVKASNGYTESFVVDNEN